MRINGSFELFENKNKPLIKLDNGHILDVLIKRMLELYNKAKW